MVINRRKEERRVGRPPSGLRAGENVRDYPQLSTRLPPEALAKLQALSDISDRPMWRVVVDAVDCYLRERPVSEQQLVKDLLRSSAAGRKRVRP
jgi:hypothetical protein